MEGGSVALWAVQAKQNNKQNRAAVLQRRWAKNEVGACTPALELGARKGMLCGSAAGPLSLLLLLLLCLCCSRMLLASALMHMEFLSLSLYSQGPAGVESKNNSQNKVSKGQSKRENYEQGCGVDVSFLVRSGSFELTAAVALVLALTVRELQRDHALRLRRASTARAHAACRGGRLRLRLPLRGGGGSSTRDSRGRARERGSGRGLSPQCCWDRRRRRRARDDRALGLSLRSRAYSRGGCGCGGVVVAVGEVELRADGSAHPGPGAGCSRRLGGRRDAGCRCWC